ncbi:MAG: 50S ribosomal protein L31 [Candidatus Levybacteria bacterium]|nr:50S ribosomal protein L31 [Candidatus Levybacteria bacterium]
MKQAIHPQYFENAQVIGVCGNKFTVGSTQEVIHVELCNNCHPFYTGEQKFVDSASRIQKFQNKQKTAEEYISKKIKKQQELKKKEEGPKTLREMLSSLS